jgi:beta-glucanase (GH16 family)
VKRLAFAVLGVVLCACAATAQDTWQLVWHDEFNGTAGTKPDPAKWGYDLGRGNPPGWGNSEWETYTNSAENASLDGTGNLVINAIKTGEGAGGYTSARLKTQGLYSTTYGKIEARIKIPYGQGIWPAFWMLGDDISTVSWPRCGEIDIMENIGKETSTVHGTIHGPGYSGANGIGASYSMTGNVSDAFHVFTVIWKTDSIEFQVDGNTFKTITPANIPAGQTWVFDKPFFIIMNLAVGGGWPGYPDATTVFPQTMTIDYVRVYKPATGAAIHKDGIVNAASYKSSLTPGALASAFGVNLSGTTQDNLFNDAAGSFPTTVGGVSVSVDGHPAALTYISPTQVNFQVPWEVTSTSAPVQITNGSQSGAEPASLASAAPSVFADGNGVAIASCSNGVCTLWQWLRQPDSVGLDGRS